MTGCDACDASHPSPTQGRTRSGDVPQYTISSSHSTLGPSHPRASPRDQRHRNYHRLIPAPTPASLMLRHTLLSWQRLKGARHLVSSGANFTVLIFALTTRIRVSTWYTFAVDMNARGHHRPSALLAA